MLHMRINVNVMIFTKLNLATFLTIQLSPSSKFQFSCENCRPEYIGKLALNDVENYYCLKWNGIVD